MEPCTYVSTIYILFTKLSYLVKKIKCLFFQAKRLLKNVDKYLARIKDRLDIDDADDYTENDEKMIK